MSGEKIFTSINEFMDSLKNNGMTKVAFSEVRERRAEQTRDDLLEVVVIKEVDILSYKNSVIYKYSDKGDGIENLYNTLISNGFEVKRINKNIT